MVIYIVKNLNLDNESNYTGRTISFYYVHNMIGDIFQLKLKNKYLSIKKKSDKHT